MSYRNDQPYSYPPPAGGNGQQPYNYGPPPPASYGGPPPLPRADYPGPRFQPGPGAGGGGRSPLRGGGGGGYGGPPPPRGREFAAPVDQGWGSRQRRRSASPGYDRGAPGRDGPPGGYGGGGGGYGGPDRGGYGAGGDRGEYNSRANGPRELSVLDPGRGRRRIPRDEGDTGLTEEEHARIVEERKRKEQPCRTLFVRNVKYGVTADQVRERFERIGDIRTCFDMLEKRGMLFITYFDIRAAMMAKDQLQGSMINGRPIDVHFSLPRDADLAKRCDREKGQGTLALTVVGARGPIEDRELMDRFGAFGEVHSVAPDPTRPDQRLIQFFDSRGSERAYDQLNDAPLAGGRMDLRFMWDPPPSLLPRMPPREQQRDQYGYGPPPGQAPPPAVPYAGNYGAPPPPPPAALAYGGASPYGAPAAAGAPADEDRLAQALKVQKLLESLGKGAVPPPSAPSAAPAPYGAPAGGAYGAPPPPPAPYGQPPASAGSYGTPQPQGYGASPLPPSGSSNSPPQPAAPALPPALLALLGKSGAPAAGASGYSPQGSAGGTPPYQPAPPQAAGGSAPPPPPPQAPPAGGDAPAAPPAAPAQVQELLSLLAQQQKQQNDKQ
ncbi:hypothetical protein BCR35DRAFT_302727 [Leucosporidium creatinivorum]|uniref:RRM domain-containing protein n=1 Tax=Leucosporidium creatinivorum TaxID=106004 RepID=A0A1Y2FQ13_9BASI|nr:hypothetical protein BCR35DRAFT_302727 [Leucosporidium creatinivorum]